MNQVFLIFYHVLKSSNLDKVSVLQQIMPREIRVKRAFTWVSREIFRLNSPKTNSHETFWGTGVDKTYSYRKHLTCK